MDLRELEAKALDLRVDIITMLEQAKSGHPGGSLSAADIMTALYFGGIMNHDPNNPTKEDRDRFVLSKGHAAPALYAALAEAGYFPKEELVTLRKLGSKLQGHPDCKKLAGVEVSTGSLGQGLSIAAGMACGLKLKGAEQTVYTLLGDGECQEGQVWEAAMFSAHRNLDNLVAIVDHNKLQIDGNIEDVCSPEDLGDKFRAFGWQVFVCDGNDMEAVMDTLTSARGIHCGKPKAVIAETTKGKGVSFMEGQAGWHGKAPNAEQSAQAVAELTGKEVEHV
ncbi:Transketolase [Slackia heliotrinireducens]|uniref:Transketolase subunit A n=1 Tax=Slackia heliotrinireducens (strain ATCC 29202 / DSM 20476 / NCTC 11029 / RHS 1) TaxID=471855 RepID=C7N4W2_SLAHD|nr:transketolase [Slackia heliotrinireducens]ACV21947.1 transketolase subunit A [Slackia heliotrinireducens DSM 20476]VEG99792.1 Transketolase [Slackia heliotrinireducens]